MKIGYFVTLFPYPETFTDSKLYYRYPAGGAENVAYYLARYMRKLGHEINVFTASIDSKSSLEKSDGMEIYRYGTSFKIQKAFFSIAAYIDSIKHDVDIVHLHFSTPPGDLLSWYYAKVKRKPFIVSYHGDVEPNYGNLTRRISIGLFDRLGVPGILSASDSIICASEPYINQSHILPRYKEKIHIITNGIDPSEIETQYTKGECREKLQLSPDDKIILFLGAFIKYKNPDLLIKALPKVIDSIPEAKLIMVGDGIMRQQLEQLTNKLGLTDKVFFTGALFGKMKSLHYKAADVFIISSVLNTEVFPITLLEASAVGLPIIVSNLPAYQCIIKDNWNGIVYKAGDVDAMANAVILLLKNSTLRETMGRNARENLKNYNWIEIAKETEKLYERTLANVK